MIKVFLILLFLFSLTSCSLNENSKIWNSKKKNLSKNKNIEIILDEKKLSYDELNPNIKLDLSKIKIQNKITDNLNDFGTQGYSGKLKKIKNFNFSKFDFENSIKNKPVFLNNGIILFDNKGSIIRFDNNAKIIWKKNFYSKSEKKNNPQLSFLVNGNKLVAIDSLSNLFLINIENGNLFWSKKNDYPFNSEIKILKDKFFAIDLKNVLKCFYLSDGKECWRVETDKTFTVSNEKNSLLILENLVIFINNLGDITAVDILSGNIIWQLPTQSSDIINSTYNFKNSKLVSDGKNIYFSNNFNEFYSIDTKNGSINWVNNINSTLTPILINDLIVTISDNGFLFVIDKKNGNIIKIKNIYKNFKDIDKKKIRPNGFSISQDKIYISNTNGKLIIAELDTGNVVKIEKISRNIISKPFIYNNNLFVIKNGTVVKYE